MKKKKMGEKEMGKMTGGKPMMKKKQKKGGFGSFMKKVSGKKKK